MIEHMNIWITYRDHISGSHMDHMVASFPSFLGEVGNTSLTGARPGPVKKAAYRCLWGCACLQVGGFGWRELIVFLLVSYEDFLLCEQSIFEQRKATKWKPAHVVLCRDFMLPVLVQFDLDEPAVRMYWFIDLLYRSTRLKRIMLQV